jgi:hypothetical protein
MQLEPSDIVDVVVVDVGDVIIDVLVVVVVVVVAVVVFDVVQHSSNSSPNCSFIALIFCSQDAAACRLDAGFFDEGSAGAAAFASCGAASRSRGDAATRGLA